MLTYTELAVDMTKSHVGKLNWERLASRRWAARMVMFYKSHHKLVEVNMPLNWKLHVRSTHNENSLAYHIPTTSTEDQKNSFFHRTVPDWNCLPKDTVCSSTPESFRASTSPWNTFTVWFSTFTGESEKRPFRKERETCRQSLWHCDCWLSTSTLHTVNYPTWSESSTSWSLTIYWRRIHKRPALHTASFFSFPKNNVTSYIRIK